MSMNDPIADMLTRIRNASQARLPKVSIPYSKIKMKMVDILKAQGFIASAELVPHEGHLMIDVVLKYTPSRKPVLQGLKRVSKCGCRQYVGKDDVPHIQGGLGLAILSTSHGILSDSEARDKGVGGELICTVW